MDLGENLNRTGKPKESKKAGENKETTLPRSTRESLYTGRAQICHRLSAAQGASIALLFILERDFRLAATARSMALRLRNLLLVVALVLATAACPTHGRKTTAELTKEDRVSVAKVAYMRF